MEPTTIWDKALRKKQNTKTINRPKTAALNNRIWVCIWSIHNLSGASDILVDSLTACVIERDRDSWLLKSVSYKALIISQLDLSLNITTVSYDVYTAQDSSADSIMNRDTALCGLIIG